MASNLMGWELLYHSVENAIEKKEDILIVLIHWVFIKNGYRCIGLGSDDKGFTGDEPTSELLPKDWNRSATYGLRYVNNKTLFILRGVKAEDDIVFNLLRAKDKALSSITLKTSNTVKALHGPLEVIMPSYNEVISQIKETLLNPLEVLASKEVHTQTLKPEQGPSPSPRYNEYPDPLQVGPIREPQRSRYADPMNIGRSDLDPLGSFAPPGSGGMIFDPFPLSRPGLPGFGAPGGLPRGSIPPGARFDPIGPDVQPLPRPRRPPPDSDHLPPPGYDDMFM